MRAETFPLFIYHHLPRTWLAGGTQEIFVMLKASVTVQKAALGGDVSPDELLAQDREVLGTGHDCAGQVQVMQGCSGGSRGPVSINVHFRGLACGRGLDHPP